MDNTLHIKKDNYISSLVKEAFDLFKKNWLHLILSIVALYAIAFLFGFISGESFWLSIISQIVINFLGLGLALMFLDVVDGKKASFLGALQRITIKHVIYAFIAGLIAAILTMIGLVFLIIPGIIISIGLSMAHYLVIDKNAGVLSSLEKSWNLTKGYRWRMFVLGIISVLIAIAGIIALGIGLFVAIPVISLMFAKLYRELTIIKADSTQELSESKKDEDKKESKAEEVKEAEVVEEEKKEEEKE